MALTQQGRTHQPEAVSASSARLRVRCTCGVVHEALPTANEAWHWTPQPTCPLDIVPAFNAHMKSDLRVAVEGSVVDARAAAEARCEMALGWDEDTRAYLYYALYNSGLRLDAVMASLRLRRWL